MSDVPSLSLDLSRSRIAPTLGAGAHARELDRLAASWAAPDLVAALAASHQHEDVHLLDSVRGAGCLQLEDRPVRRVAVYYHRLGTGGAELVSEQLVELWRSMGLEVLVLCDEGTGSEARGRRLGCAVETLPEFEASQGAAYGARARALASALDAHGTDVLVYGQWTSPILAWDLLLARLLGVATIVFCHASSRVLTTYGQPALLRLPGLYRHAQAVVCLGGEDASFWGQFHERVFRTPNRVDAAFVPRPRTGSDAPTILWVGRISSDKAPLDALSVLHLVRRQVGDARLVMAGPFGDVAQDEVLAEARRLDVADALELRGSVPHDQLPEVFAEADVYLLTSHAEGYCISLGEAKASGLACVSYELTNLTLLEGGRGVAVAPIGDVAGLADAVVALLRDRAARDALGQAARAHMAELAAFDYRGLWDEVLACARKPPADAARGAVAAWMMADTGMRAQLVQEDRDAKYEELLAEQGKCEAVRRELADVTGSVSFRVGRALTGPLRAGRDLIRR